MQASAKQAEYCFFALAASAGILHQVSQAHAFYICTVFLIDLNQLARRAFLKFKQTNATFSIQRAVSPVSKENNVNYMTVSS